MTTEDNKDALASICQHCMEELKDTSMVLVGKPGDRVYGQWCSVNCFKRQFEEIRDGERIPRIDLESKKANWILRYEGVYSKAMHYAWNVGTDQVLVVEDIPENYPRLTVYVIDRKCYFEIVRVHRKEWEIVDTC